MAADYEDIAQALARTESEVDAAECHGILTGLLTADADADTRRWRDEVIGEGSAGDLLAREARERLDALETETRAQLNDPHLGFYPLLPHERRPLPERVEPLARWCQGFVYGLAMGGVHAESELPANSREFLQDVSQISTVFLSVADDQENESAYQEIVEYIRTGVLLMHEELQPSHAPPQMPSP